MCDPFLFKLYIQLRSTSKQEERPTLLYYATNNNLPQICFFPMQLTEQAI